MAHVDIEEFRKLFACDGCVSNDVTVEDIGGGRVVASITCERCGKQAAMTLSGRVAIGSREDSEKQFDADVKQFMPKLAELIEAQPGDINVVFCGLMNAVGHILVERHPDPAGGGLDWVADQLRAIVKFKLEPDEAAAACNPAWSDPPIDAMTALVEYLECDERKHFAEMEDNGEDTSTHIYHSVKVVRDWLSDNGVDWHARELKAFEETLTAAGLSAADAGRAFGISGFDGDFVDLWNATVGKSGSVTPRDGLIPG
jgi:hypothetical protein